MCLFEAKRKQTSLGIVVIATIAEGIEICIVGSRTTVVVSSSKVAPGVIGVGNELGTIFIVDSNNIALQILLKPEGIECVRRVSGVTIHHTDRGTF